MSQYLKSFYKKAKRMLPDWQVEAIHRQARAQTGGLVKGRNFKKKMKIITKDEDWITVNGSHILVGDEGQVKAGPKIGKPKSSGGAKTTSSTKGKEPNKEESLAIRNYSGSLSSQFIDADRGKDHGNEIKEKNDKLNSYLDRAPKYEGTIHRGISVEAKDAKSVLDKYKEGKEIKLDAKESWTKSGDAVKNRISSVANSQKDPVKIEFEYKNSRKGVDISNHSRFSEEQEVLVPKGTSYKVSGVHRTSDGYKIVLEDHVAKSVNKSDPGMSDVHVPTAGYEKPKKKLKKEIYTPEITNEGPKVIKEGFTDLYDMQCFIDGLDCELASGQEDPDKAVLAVTENLAKDKEFYKKKRDPIAMDGGLDIDLGSGENREDGHIGFDLYPHDHGTIVHDLNMGIPLPDSSARRVKIKQALHLMDDPKPMLAEIQRVLMPQGEFVYEGPNELYNYPEDFVMTMYEDGPISKDDSSKCVRQTFTRVAMPDPATANDAEPRIGVPQFDMLPADALLAMDALGYYTDDAGVGKKDLVKGMIKKAFDAVFQKKTIKGAKQVPIFKADQHKQVVYGVVLAPDEVDAQEDWMTAEDIEKAAHSYLMSSRVIGSGHAKPIDACPVESFIAPQDFTADGQYGNQKVKKGSWVLGIKIKDPEEWKKVLSGDYQAFSVGGLGLRK